MKHCLEALGACSSTKIWVLGALKLFVMQFLRGKITPITVFCFWWSLLQNPFPSTPPGLRGGGESFPSLFLSDLIVTCVHLCSRFVGEERGMHTQVKQSLFPGLPYLDFHHLQC